MQTFTPLFSASPSACTVCSLHIAEDPVPCKPIYRRGCMAINEGNICSYAFSAWNCEVSVFQWVGHWSVSQEALGLFPAWHWPAVWLGHVHTTLCTSAPWFALPISTVSSLEQGLSLTACLPSALHIGVAWCDDTNTQWRAADVSDGCVLRQRAQYVYAVKINLSFLSSKISSVMKTLQLEPSL